LSLLFLGFIGRSGSLPGSHLADPASRGEKKKLLQRCFRKEFTVTAFKDSIFVRHSLKPFVVYSLLYDEDDD
jgi:hypothetical protein